MALIASKGSRRDAREFAAAGHPVEAAPRGDHETAVHDHGDQTPAPRRTVKPGLGIPPWPLIAVLAVQVLLSLRLIWSNTAFQDEALYLRAGHLEWARWLHHTPIPDFSSYFSGAPVFYPPLGALADSIGGLAAARILSLCFMLGVTSLLWATASRLYGQRAALLAAALFATLAGTQFLGAFATFDALALFLLALAVWLGVRSANGELWTRTALLVTSGVALAAADVAKYAAALFTPVVLAVVALAVWRLRAGGAWLTALLTLLGTWLMLIVAAIVAAGGGYWRGVTTSTLGRPQSDIPVRTVLHSSYIWTGLILVLAFLGAVLAVRGETRGRLLPVVLAAAALLVPAEQARLHTAVSLQKHVVFGAWFAAIAAGYAMARMSRVDPGRGWAPVMALPIAAATLFGSMGQAASLFKVWPNAGGVVSLLRSAIRSHPGNYLAEDYDVEAYYLGAEAPWPRWSSTYYFRYQNAPAGESSYASAIDRHYFSLVILDFGDTEAVDTKITADMRAAGGYYVLGRAGRFTVWAARAAAPARPSRGNHVRD